MPMVRADTPRYSKRSRRTDMSFSAEVLRNDERAVYDLRALYRKYGYTPYKVGKFEEYDLYAHNKSFLVSENVLTFTDTNGKLMALKPDVTLSIIKNISADGRSTAKLYYDENVYRTSAESNGFKEIMQTGVECIGYIDVLSQSEVIMLAARSLEGISSEYRLDVSHMGLVEGLIDATDADMPVKDALRGFIKSKNTAEIKRLAESGAICGDMAETICTLTETYVTLAEALELVCSSAKNTKMSDAAKELSDICNAMKAYGLGERIYFDFSVVNDRNYYDGVIFKGFINGIPEGVLSGGRYDKLIVKMGKSFGAIGFAVYLDRLERFGTSPDEYDTDILLVYGDGADANAVIGAVAELTAKGYRVRTATDGQTSVRYRQLIKLDGEGAEGLEAND